MILKGKARQRESKLLFNGYLKALEAAMTKAIAAGDQSKAQALSAKCKDFEKFEFKHIELESGYAAAHEAAVQAITDIERIIFEMEKNAVTAAADRIDDIAARANTSVNEYVVKDKAEQIKALASGLKGQLKAATKSGDYAAIIASLNEILGILKDVADKPAPNFFRMAYYLTFAGKPLPEMPVEQLNDYLLEYLDKEFMPTISTRIW